MNIISIITLSNADIICSRAIMLVPTLDMVHSSFGHEAGTYLIAETTEYIVFSRLVAILSLKFSIVLRLLEKHVTLSLVCV